MVILNKLVYFILFGVVSCLENNDTFFTTRLFDLSSSKIQESTTAMLSSAIVSNLSSFLLAHSTNQPEDVTLQNTYTAFGDKLVYEMISENNETNKSQIEQSKLIDEKFMKTKNIIITLVNFTNAESVTQSLSSLLNGSLPFVQHNVSSNDSYSLNLTDSDVDFNNRTLLNDTILFMNQPDSSPDKIYNALMITLVIVAILAVISLVFLIFWKLRCSGLSGEWILNDTIYGRTQPMVSAFDNACTYMDSVSCAPSSTTQLSSNKNNGFSAQYAPLIQSNHLQKMLPTKNGNTNAYNNLGMGVGEEMVEMIEKTFGGERKI